MGDAPWTQVDVSCTHCGEQLEVRPKPNHRGPILEGLRPMEVRHAADHSERCTITRTYPAEPYSAWSLEPAWAEAREGRK